MESQAQKVLVNLNIHAEEYLKVYQGSGKIVYCHDVQGRSVSFPAKILQPFVSRTGVQGLFEIRFDRSGKFQSIYRMI